MIGVVAKSQDLEIVEEFFQLFKTPWEFYHPGHLYDVLLVAGDNPPESGAPLIVIYGSQRLLSDVYQVSENALHKAETCAVWGASQIPLYEKAITFSHDGSAAVLYGKSGMTLGYETQKSFQRILRIGYDLFGEISVLLTKGQPLENALIPTLDLHIALLRGWILDSGIDLVEIPPVPAGYELITCLTHDVDFIGIRRHFLDHSMSGFLYRATMGSLVDYFQKKASFAKLRENLKSALALPFVFLGMYRDPWDQFDHYLKLEGDAPSTFFFIPYKNHPGEGYSQNRDKYRATRYDVDDVRDIIGSLRTHGCEIGVHGIDAWHSVERGTDELDRVRAVTGQENIGIRMHWLCMNEHTFRKLDQAGYNYDTSFGYNEAVGFKAGTAQVYKPLGVKRLLELPLHIQDTALFSPGRLNSPFEQAEQLCDQIIGDVYRHKGVLTLLWHQRSLGPERLWGGFYQMLIKKLQNKNAWFATAGDAVNWFRVRRLACFLPSGEIDVPYRLEENGKIPYLVLRNYTSDNHILKRNQDAESRFNQFDLEFTEETIQPIPS